MGVSGPVGSRWFRDRGGMPSIQLTSGTDRFQSFVKREDIALLLRDGKSIRHIARELDRSPSTISREVRRNAATRSGKLEYRASVAQWKAELMARRAKPAKLVANDRLREYVQDRLAGNINAADGTTIVGPSVAFKGRRHGRRKDRRWATAWSPEQIANRLKLDFPDDESMRTSHEADLPGAGHPGPRRAEARTRRMSSDWSCAARAASPPGQPGQEVRDRPGDDLRTAGRGEGPRGARALGISRRATATAAAGSEGYSCSWSRT
ncbi:Mobile element protein [Euzebya pacifica]|uniref:Mobile element protein n=1 Tax=Euzebya pacifica TaxID=1608957 RepID=A0A346XVX7_9ACTN|nr:Mobile element protein [Euzebya pacifica]